MRRFGFTVIWICLSLAACGQTKSKVINQKPRNGKENPISTLETDKVTTEAQPQSSEHSRTPIVNRNEGQPTPLTGIGELAAVSPGEMSAVVRKPAVSSDEKRDSRPLRTPPNLSRGKLFIDDSLSSSTAGSSNRSGSSHPKKTVSRRKMTSGPILGKNAIMGLGSGYGHSGIASAGALYARGRLPLQRQHPGYQTEQYAHQQENSYRYVKDNPLSTFSIDVDTASYSNLRRFLFQGRIPPVDAIRIEEMINYFEYLYKKPEKGLPFSIYSEVSDAPWDRQHRLLHIGLKGLPISDDHLPARNLVFLIDVSGSMQSYDKLPLLKQGLSFLAKRLRSQDHVALVVYAGASGVVLEPTSGQHQNRILNALDQLQAGGSTNGAAGIELAYQVAKKSWIKGGINRVILATDGDFNVGVSSQGDLVRLIEEKRKTGIFLTVLGFGQGNLKDSTMELLADKGNGNYAYIDSSFEAEKVLVRESGSTLMTIAKDVKLQLEFNPTQVERYRLIGYENRILAARDFNDDSKDAGEIGAGHTVTALYEIVLKNESSSQNKSEIDPLKYQDERSLSEQAHTEELLTIKIRYKDPDAATSKRLTHAVTDRGLALENSTDNFRFSAAVAGFGMLLRGSEHKGKATIDMLRRLALSAMGRDEHGDRHEFLKMIKAAEMLGIGG